MQLCQLLQNVTIGNFNTPEEASEAYQNFVANL